MNSYNELFDGKHHCANEFLFVFVIGRLKCLCAEKSNDKLFAEKKEEELMCSKFEYMRE